MRVTWTPKAVQDFKVIIETIALDNKSAADTLRERILSAITTTLATAPLIGRQGRVAGTREFVVHASYILVYRVAAARIEILTLRHTARLWPAGF